MTTTDIAGVELSLTWTDTRTDALRSYSGPAPITIGRDFDNAIVLSNLYVSRRHARIDYQDGELVIVNERSRTGVEVNGRSVEQAVLRPGDRFTIGPFVFQLGEELDAEGTRMFQLHGDGLLPLGQLEEPGEFPPACFDAQLVSMGALRRSGLELEEVDYLAVGGGLGSFAWVDHLRVAGVAAGQIVALGLEPKPHGRYARLCRNSQIPTHERLRSNSDSCPDNLWGWPGYAVREGWRALLAGQVGEAAHVAWQVFGEPTFAETYTPRAADVFASIEREARRIGWGRIWRYGHVKAIRKTDDGRYVAAYTQAEEGEPPRHRLIVARHVHLAVGYPGVRFLPDLQRYRERTGDFRGVVNAYENHDHVYAHLLRRGGTVLLRGRGIVASRILQRLNEVRAQNPRVSVLHLMRAPQAEGSRHRRARRAVRNHWELQPFNWPKACWGGELRRELERADAGGRGRLLEHWGGTTTARRRDWDAIVERGLREGWYQIRFGEVRRIERSEGRLLTVVEGRAPVQDETRLCADFIIDCTGLEAEAERSSLLRDLVEHHGLELNAKGRLLVADDFELRAMRNGAGRIYAAGVMTLGGPYAPVDSFLGLQYAAQKSLEALTAAGAPGLRPIYGLRSLVQWTRWAKGVQP